jgi:membrane protein implicated in regulation of membrane protease activity
VNFLQRAAAVVVGMVFLVLAFIFASVIFAVAAILALMIWGWLMWRTRHLRREMDRQQGTVVEGEYRVEREVRSIDEDRR